ncbi:MAG: hypothetical protein ABEJ66_01190 [Candidatus Nanohaloarchaea archaeon]
MEEKKYCPNCGSEDIEPAHEQLWGFKKSPNIWSCPDCGYQGIVPSGEKDEVEFEPEEFPETEVEVRDWHMYVFVLAAVFSVMAAAAVLTTVLP